MTAWLDPEEQRTWRMFLAASRGLMEILDRELQRDAGMPHTYYEILVRLSEAPDHRLRMTDLAQATCLSRSRLSHAAARLEKFGWIRRVECPEDRRGQVAILTPDGDAVLTAAAPGHVEGVRRHLFDALDTDQVRHLREISEALLRQRDVDPSAS